jgi:hydroxymethylpyrimidine pyrophosphatase-like HAD family hydrolase
MYFKAIATDYDGALACDGCVANATLAALKKWKHGGELCWIFGDGVNQAADFFSDATSIPSGKVTPLTTFGN